MSPPPSIAAATGAASLAVPAPVPLALPAIRDGTFVAIGFIIVATLFFAMGDVVAKALTASVHPLEITWFRFVMFAATIPVYAVAMRGPRALATRRPGLQLARGLATTCGSTLFIIGLGYLPVAENTAIAFLGPVFITVLSIPLLGEKVGLRRWAALVVGFAGVMIIVRPGTAAFQLAALLPMSAALLGAFGSIFTRQMADEPAETTLSWSALVGIVSLSLAVPFVWTAPTLHEIGLGIATGLLSTAGHVFVVLAFRKAEASVLAPFSYVHLLFVGVLSYLVFSDVPSAWTFAGGGVIAASGLYTAHRERVRAREQRLEAARSN